MSLFSPRFSACTVALFSTTMVSSFLVSTSVEAAGNTANTELEKLEQQITVLEQQVKQIKAQNSKEVVVNAAPDIHVGGAIRFNYNMVSYDDDNEKRGGDIDFDLVRLNFSGGIADIGVNAEIRFLDYMRVVKFAYLDYDFSDDWHGQLGLAPVPFGNAPHSGFHSYFMSPNYFIGLQEDYDLGLVLKHKATESSVLDIAFFKNDEHGGVDGGAEERKDRYSVDALGIRLRGENIHDAPTTTLAEYNTLVGRYTYQLEHQFGTTHVGFSALDGGLHDGVSRIGDHEAWALHASTHIGQWRVHLQHTQYQYHIDNVRQIVVGANSMYDTIASEATSTNLAVSYDLSVDIGPISQLSFYNDFGSVYNKSDDTANTWMNITGMSISAGALFTYVDLVHAKNQPFVGGSIAGNSDNFERRLNINVGYYF
ncbi:carbohydrate porin [Pseudoalteromonas phenolica]|uniref:carbohydrate porin n=1 Tax=Pseudoalteromonas phenolica TaxID=161398 RepID=UPI00207BBF8F|nr:carbohydrate porin [Pseudoalteromonas phenolica]